MKGVLYAALMFNPDSLKANMLGKDIISSEVIIPCIKIRLEERQCSAFFIDSFRLNRIHNHCRICLKNYQNAKSV